MKLLGLLLWLRIRLMINSCRSLVHTLDNFLAIITMIAIIFISLAFGVGALILAVVESENNRNYLHFVMAIPFLVWFLTPYIYSKGEGGNLFDLKRMVIFPMSLKKIAIWNLVATIFEPVILFCIPSFIGYAIGTLLNSPLLGMMYLVSLIAYIAFGMVFFRLNGTLVLLKSSFIFFIAKIFAVLMIVLSLPFLWISFGMISAAQGNLLWWFLSVIAIVSLTIILAITELKCSIKAAGQPDTDGPPRRCSRGVGLLESKLDPVIAREIISLRRQNMFFFPIMASVLTAIVFIVVEIMKGKIIPVSSLAWFWSVFSLSAFCWIIYCQTATNTWAAEGTGIRCFFSIPYEIVHLYRRKAAGGLILFSVWYIISLIISLIACRPGILEVLSLTVLVYAMMLYTFGVGAMNSTWFPYPRAGAKSASRKAMRNYVTGWVQLAFFGPFIALILTASGMLCSAGLVRIIGAGLALFALIVAVAVFFYCPIIAARYRNGTPEHISQELELAK